MRRDASLSWHDPAHLRTLGATAVGELRCQGERKSWDSGRTDTAVRTGLNDHYAGAAGRRAQIERARKERRVTEIVGGVIGVSDQVIGAGRPH